MPCPTVATMTRPTGTAPSPLSRGCRSPCSRLRSSPLAVAGRGVARPRPTSGGAAHGRGADRGPGGPGAGRHDRPRHHPVPARPPRPRPPCCVAHGFGGTKASVDADARALVDRGFVVLAWTARGFGASGGQITLDSPDYEVADARALVDRLAARPEVVQDGPGDPRVGVTGGSYGGALALLLAGLRPRGSTRIGAADHLERPGPGPVPERRGGAAAPAGRHRGARPRSRAGRGVQAGRGPAVVLRRRPAPAPGRRSRGRGGAAGGDEPPAATTAATAARAAVGAPAAGSPRRCAPPTRRPPTTGPPPPRHPPTLLCAAPARPRSPTGSPRRRCSSRARRTRCSGSTRPTPTPGRSPRPAAPVRVLWYGGGHDGGAPDQRVRDAHRRAGSTTTSPATAPTRARAFSYTVASGVRTRRRHAHRAAPSRRRPTPAARPATPGRCPTQPLPLSRRRRRSRWSRPGGSPAAITSLPGLGGRRWAASATGSAAFTAELPGQSAVFRTRPGRRPAARGRHPAGRPHGRPGAGPGRAGRTRPVLFGKVYDGLRGRHRGRCSAAPSRRSGCAVPADGIAPPGSR